MNAFDHLVVDFGSANGDLIGINILAPTVTTPRWQRPSIRVAAST
jgi:hypothetical protein